MFPKIVEKLGLTTAEENDMICSAIYHHDDKLIVDAPFDELLKDADVIDHSLTDPAKAIKEKEKEKKITNGSPVNTEQS